MPWTIEYAIGNNAMEQSMQPNAKTPRLAWAVLAQGETGRSEVIKITEDHEDADDTVRNNPKLFWKSGPIVIPA